MPEMDIFEATKESRDWVEKNKSDCGLWIEGDQLTFGGIDYFQELYEMLIESGDTITEALDEVKFLGGF
jgi:hypothetical protein